MLVTSLDEQTFPTIVMPKHYRDRADAENCFDELKNQWGWGGFTSRKLAPSRLMANLVALFYNWWNLYLRFYDEEHHIRAITERWSVEQRWALLLTRLLRRWLGGKWLPGVPEEAAMLLSG